MSIGNFEIPRKNVLTLSLVKIELLEKKCDFE